MSFGEQLRKRREELGISRVELAGRLGISRSAVGNYETGVSAPKEEVLLRLFDTPGIPQSAAVADTIGVGPVQAAARQASLALLVLDGSRAASGPTRSRPCWRDTAG